MQTFQELIVWQKAHALVLAVYRVTQRYPKEELYSLTSQTRRAASSIAANIVEGHGRKGHREFRSFMNTAYGSACELEYHLLLAKDLCFLPPDDWNALSEHAIEVKKLLKSWLAKLGDSA